MTLDERAARHDPALLIPPGTRLSWPTDPKGYCWWSAARVSGWAAAVSGQKAATATSHPVRHSDHHFPPIQAIAHRHWVGASKRTRRPNRPKFRLRFPSPSRWSAAQPSGYAGSAVLRRTARGQMRLRCAEGWQSPTIARVLEDALDLPIQLIAVGDDGNARRRPVLQDPAG